MKSHIGFGKSPDVRLAVNEAMKEIKNPKAIFIFALDSMFEEANRIVNEIYKNITVVGVSTYGFALNDVIKDNIIIWAIEEDVEIEAGILNNVTTFPIKYIKNLENSINNIKPGKEDTVCLEFCTGGEEKLVSTISSLTSKNNIPLVGGTALTGDKGKRYISLNGQVYTDACVYILIKNKSGKVKVYKENIYKDRAKNLIANKVDRDNRKIMQIDGKAAEQIYCENLGITKNEIQNRVLTNPLGKVIGKETFITAIQGGENGSLKCYKRINQNDVLHILDLDNYDEVIHKTVDQIKSDFTKVSAIFSINCILRFNLFESRNFTKEYAKIMNFCNNHVGVIGEGEQYINQHINQTMVCVVFE